MESSSSASQIFINSDAVGLALSYLARKQKWQLRHVNCHFRDLVVGRTMITLRFRSGGAVESSLFENTMKECRRVEKLDFNEVELTKAGVERFCGIISKQPNILSRIKTLHLTHVTFQKEFYGSSAEPAFYRFATTLCQFETLEELSLSSVGDFASILKYMAKVQTVKFSDSLTTLSIIGCEIREESIPAIYKDLSDFILRFPNLSHVDLQGLRIGEHLEYLIPFSKHKKTRSLNLELNGLEPEYCLYLKFLINFETLECLNLSHNWIGLHGLEHLKDHFAQFKNLRVLKLGANKLFNDENPHTEVLRDALSADGLTKTLEELHLYGNSMDNEEMKILEVALVNLSKLRVFDLSNNQLTGDSVTSLMDRFIESGVQLYDLRLASNLLHDEGVAQLLVRVRSMVSIRYLNIAANRLKATFIPEFEAFVRDFNPTRPLNIEMKMQNLRKSDITALKESIKGIQKETKRSGFINLSI